MNEHCEHNSSQACCNGDCGEGRRCPQRYPNGRHDALDELVRGIRQLAALPRAAISAARAALARADGGTGPRTPDVGARFFS